MCRCDLTIVDTDLAHASACYTIKFFPLCVTQILFKPDFKCNLWMKIIVLMHKIKINTWLLLVTDRPKHQDSIEFLSLFIFFVINASWYLLQHARGMPGTHLFNDTNVWIYNDNDIRCQMPGVFISFSLSIFHEELVCLIFPVYIC